jgi:uncharacterized membrane protein
MDDLTWARVLHVCAIVGWVGSLWFVSLSLLPAVKSTQAPEQRMAVFRPLAGGHTRQSQIWVALIGVSGLWMLWRGDMWARLESGRFWWMHVMVGVWVVFAIILFVLEPLSRRRPRPESGDPASVFAGVVKHHRVLSIVALVTLVVSLAGSHGLF